MVGLTAAAPPGGEVATKLGLPTPSKSDYPKDIVKAPVAADAPGKKADDQAGDKCSELPVSERLARVCAADAACSEVLSALSATADMKGMLLGMGEEEVLSLATLGFEGMPVAPNEAVMGPGVLMLSKTGKVGSMGHRLHFCLTHTSASISGREAWGQHLNGCCCCFNIFSSVEGEYAATRGQEMKLASVPLEDSLYHVQGVFKEESMFASKFGSRVFEAEVPKKDGCACKCPSCNCINPCCTCVCPAWAPCLWPVIDLCPCSKRGPKPTGGTWASSAYQKGEAMPGLSIAKESTEDVTYRFPGVEQTCPTDTAVVMRTMHRVQLVYHNSSTNSMQQCTALISPSEPVKRIAAFVSELSTHVKLNPDVPKASTWSAPAMQSMADVGAAKAGSGMDLALAKGMSGCPCVPKCLKRR